MSRRGLCAGYAFASALVGAAIVQAVADDEADGLRMSKPVVCRKIHGYASVEELPGAALTADDKLTIYYEPSGHTIEKTKDGFRALLVQDGRLRKKGSKDVIWKKEPMFEYEPRNASPPYQVYMRTDASIKGLPPGDYELDLTVHDRLAKDARTTRTVAFKVIPPREKDEPEGGHEATGGGKPK